MTDLPPLQTELALQTLTIKNFQNLDSSGKPYYLHKLRVGNLAARLALEAGKSIQFARDARMVGFTHDFVEDIKEYNSNPNLLVEQGLPAHLLPSVLSVTHQPGESYCDSIIRAKQDPIGRFVKMADNTDNSTLSRFPIFEEEGHLIRFLNPLEKGMHRHMKYFLSYLYLANAISINTYKCYAVTWDQWKEQSGQAESHP